MSTFPTWLPEAHTRYVAGESIKELDRAYRADVHYWFEKADLPHLTREQGLQRALRQGKRAVAWRISIDTDDTLDRNIARIEAQIADDLTRGGSAFTNG